MMGKEILDTQIKQEIKENNVSEIASTGLNPAEAKMFWDNVFKKDAPKMSFEELCEEMLWRFEEEFEFDFELDKETEAILEKFELILWEQMDNAERHETIIELVNLLSDLQGLPEVPDVEFLDDSYDSYGFYSERGNYIGINENYIEDGKEIANTVAHETRHAYQRYRAEKMENAQDELYKFNFDHYIAPEYDANGKFINALDYYYQYVEVEARVFANKISPEEEV